jgi:hypothetical protein
MATPMAWLSFLMKNREVRRRTVQEVRTRSHTVQGPRPNTRVTHSWGAYPSAHIPRQLSAHPWGFSVVFSQQYWVIMVSARGIDYFIIIIEPHDPWFEEELAYIKQRRSFGLCIFCVFEYLKIWSIGFSVLKRLIYKGEVRSELAKGDLLSTSSDLSIWGYFSPSPRYAEAPKVQCVGTQGNSGSGACFL